MGLKAKVGIVDMAATKLIVGLGNPGSKYSETRHNTGRMTVEYLGKIEGWPFTRRESLKASVSKPALTGNRVVLALAETYMNLSGEAVSELVSHYSVNPETDLLIVVDDLALPFGVLRLRGQGSDGGHKGLRSIQACLGTARYARLRMGIGHPQDPGHLEMPRPEVEDYVLSFFSSEEKEGLGKFVEKGAQACRLWTRESLDKAMSVVNEGMK